MTSDRSSDPSTFDALWDFDLEDGAGDDIPPALDPRARGEKMPQEKRDTLLPPVPTGEYVETMMQLGEIDDPSFALDKPAIPVSMEPQAAGGLAARLGLVLASESELLLPTQEGESPEAPAQPAPGRSRSPTSPGPAAIAVRRATEASPPRRLPPAPTAGLRAPAGLPVPRAPSIPPPVDDSLDAFSLEVIEPLDKPVSPHDSSPPPGALPTPMRPPLSARSGRTTGLRLGGRTGPRPEVEGDRVTPISMETAPSSVANAVRDMQVLFEARNYGGALLSAESVLASDPQHAEARRLAESCRGLLGQKYLSSLGGKDSVPRVCMTPDEMRDLSLDHRAGFLLSFVDGSMSIEEVLDVSSMPELDVLRMMFELRQQGAIEIRDPPQRGGRK